MPIDITGFFEAVWAGLRVIPTPIIALGLLAGPTTALIIYHFMRDSRRIEGVEGAASMWVCPDCRSANLLSLHHCYRCGRAQRPDEKIEVIVFQPAARPVPPALPARPAPRAVPVQAASQAVPVQPAPPAVPARPLGVAVGAASASVVADAQKRLPAPVMAEPPTQTAPVAVGPGRGPRARGPKGPTKPSAETAKPTAQAVRMAPAAKPAAKAATPAAKVAKARAGTAPATPVEADS